MLNATVLATEVVPALEAIETIQQVSDSVSDREPKIQVLSLTQSSPVEVSISGIAKSIEFIDEKFTPWKREFAKKIADLKLQKGELEVKKLRAEASEAEGRAVHMHLQGDIVRAE